MENIIEQRMLLHLQRAFRLYGIEGAEQKIRELYKHTPKLKQSYLNLYWNLLRAN